MPRLAQSALCAAALGTALWSAPAGSAAAPSGAASPGPFASPGPLASLASSSTTCGATRGPGDAPWPEFDGSQLHSGAGVGVAAPAGELKQVWQSAHVDGPMYGQPVLAGGCLYVATEADSVYALDATTGAVRWRVHLAAPVTGGLPCGNIGPSGITGAPVLDASTGELFVAPLTYISGRPAHELVGLRASNGQVLLRQPFALPGTDPAAQQERSALQLDKGRVYISLGGLYGDCNSYLGSVISVPEKGGSPAYWHVPTAREAGIWEPGGPAVLPDGDLLVADGNGAASKGQAFDGSNAVFELTPSLKVAGVFAPANWAALNASDGDLGSTGPAVLPGGLAFQVGKAGEGYLVEPGHLGGVGGQVYEAMVCGSGALGADAVSGEVIYVPCGSGLTAVEVKRRSFRVLWSSGSGGLGSPVVAGGRIFEQMSSGELQAFSPASGHVLQTVNLTAPVTSFPWLVAVGSHLYAASGTRVVELQGL